MNLLEIMMMPRGSRLFGIEIDGPKINEYVIEFPSPNDSVRLGPIKASSRAEALYIAVSRGGFALARSNGGGLAVWTRDEYNEAMRSLGEPQL